MDWARRRFRWRDGERLVRFGRGTADEALGLLARERLSPFALLTTARAAAALPQLTAAADTIVCVPPGPVPETAIAAESVALDAGLPVALLAAGGGRVVDVCKAIAAAHDLPCAAVPTTLSGAEMTSIHRSLADGRGAARLRPRLVIVDPAVSASQPPPELVASAMNAFGHAMEALYVAGAGPIASLAALEATRLIAEGLEALTADGDEVRDRLALGGLLAGYAIGVTGLGLHHVLCQSIVRTTGAPHAAVYAVMGPHVFRRMLEAAPEAMAPLVDVLAGAQDREAAAARLTRLAAESDVQTLGQLGITDGQLPDIAHATAARAELRATPQAPDEGGVLELLRTAL